MKINNTGVPMNIIEKMTEAVVAALEDKKGEVFSLLILAKFLPLLINLS